MRNELLENHDKIKAIITGSGYESMVAEWNRIKDFAAKQEFSICVVGEFSRGKSSLINDMLGEELLPVGVIPTTALVTEIRYGKSKRLVLDIEGEASIEFPLTSESWDEVFVKSENKKAKVRVEIPHKTIKSHGLCLIDTPGAADLDNDKLQMTIDALSSSDAVLLAINATMALSMTERSFLDQYILSKKIARVSVVSTHLDNVRAKERVDVMNFIKDGLASWAPEAVISTVNTNLTKEDADYVVAIGPQEILDLIVNWSQDEAIQSLKNEQLKSQILLLIEGLEVHLDTELSAVTEVDEKKEEKIKEIENNITTTHIDWEDIRLDMKKRSAKVVDSVVSSLRRSESDATTRLKEQLHAAENPVNWWDKEFVVLLKRELLTIGNQLKGTLEQQIANDFSWMETRVQKLFGLSLKKVDYNLATVDWDGSVVSEQGSEIMGDKNEAASLGQLRRFVRVGVAAAAIFGLVISSPLGIATSIAVGIMGDRFLKNKISKSEQKVLAGHIGEVYRLSVEHAAKEMKNRISGLYEDALTSLVDEEQEWIQSQKELVANLRNSNTEDVSGKQSLKDDLVAIKHSIQTIK